MGRKYDTENIVGEIIGLEPIEFLGICKVIGVPVFDEAQNERDFEKIWIDVCDKVHSMSRVRRKNLLRLLRAANKDR